MTKKITVERALRLLRQIVKKKGADYIYPDSDKYDGSCVYVREDGTPSCIVGHVIGRVDPKLLPRIKWWERNPLTYPPAEDTPLLDQGQYDGTSAYELSTALDSIEIDPDAVAVLAAAQGKQDGGYTWGAALEEAELVAADITQHKKKEE